MRIEELQYVTFKQTFTARIRASLLIPDTLKIISSEAWQRSFRLKRDCPFSVLCTYIEEAKCVTIKFLFHNYPTIIETISPPIYSQLLQLNLPNNDINNIQALAFLNMPLIEAIKLQGNHISTIKAFQKTKWEKLEYINVRKNHILTVDMSRAKLPQQISVWRIKQIEIDSLDQDIGKCIKMGIEKAFFMLLSQFDIIHQSKLIECIKKRFSMNGDMDFQGYYYILQ